MSQQFDPNITQVDSQPAPSIRGGTSGDRQPRIEQWSIVGYDRVVGTVFNRPGASDGKTIISSPVVQVRIFGKERAPVAFTESGSAYRLGEPAAHFGIDQAEHFIWYKSRQPEYASTRPDAESQTAYAPVA